MATSAIDTTSDEDRAQARLTGWLARFETALVDRDVTAVTALFGDECYWRDLVAFTWNIHTAEGRDAIAAMLGAQLETIDPRGFAIVGRASETGDMTEGVFTFETATARGRGLVRLKDGAGWTLLTAMEELKGHEEKSGRRRPLGAQHGVAPGRTTWLERRRHEEQELGRSEQPYCVIVGGGQGGITLAARLRRLDVPTIVLDVYPRTGDTWRNRYKSLCLHDPVWYDHLPYLPFPDDWPVYSPKDKLADWIEAYAKIMELNVWHSTECKAAAYDDESGEWRVTVDRAGESLVLRPRQLVLATGASGLPNVIDIEGASAFRGTLHHSSEHKGGEGFEGKSCVVVGSNNSAHDICADLWEHGADVTMVQRSSTHVSRSDSLFEFGMKAIYSEEAVANGITTEVADMINASLPYRIMPEFQKPVVAAIKQADADFYARLEKAGFLLDFGEDESGLHMKYLRRGSGYYIDVGASELICDGSIKLRSGVEPARFTEHALVLSDGSELPADLVVLATGYGSMNGWAARLISEEVAEKVGRCWGLGSDTARDPGPWEGELRNMWKPTRQDGLWFHGGNLYQTRQYSLHLALQIKAREAGLPLKVYGVPPVHHVR